MDSTRGTTHLTSVQNVPCTSSSKTSNLSKVKPSNCNDDHKNQAILTALSVASKPSDAGKLPSTGFTPISWPTFRFRFLRGSTGATSVAECSDGPALIDRILPRNWHTSSWNHGGWVTNMLHLILMKNMETGSPTCYTPSWQKTMEAGSQIRYTPSVLNCVYLVCIVRMLMCAGAFVCVCVCMCMHL